MTPHMHCDAVLTPLFTSVRTHPYTVLLPVLFPVVSRVAEHQQVRRQPIRAAVAALSSDGGDLGPLTQADLQPLIPV